MDNKEINTSVNNDNINNGVEPTIPNPVENNVTENVAPVVNSEPVMPTPVEQVPLAPTMPATPVEQTTEQKVETQNVDIVPTAEIVSPETTVMSTTETVIPVQNEVTNNEVVQTVEVSNPNEVKIINNEIELVIDDPNKKEEVVEEVVEEPKVEGKRLLSFISNDDLFLVVCAIVLIVIGLNLSTIHNLFSKNEYSVGGGTENPENPGENPTPPAEAKEQVLTCTKKNDESNYVFDYVYTINYKGTAYKMVYEIKSIDFNLIEDETEKNEKMEVLSKFVNDSFEYTEMALTLNGSEIDINEDGTFTQTIDLVVADSAAINRVSEVMFYNVSDSFNLIKTKFKNKGYTCK